MIVLAYILSSLSMLMSLLFFIRPKAFIVKGMVMILIMIAGSLSPYWAIIGAIGAILGWISGAYWAIPMGILGAGVMVGYLWRNTRDHKGFEEAFGPGWSDQIPTEKKRRMVQKRWSWFLNMKTSPEPILEQDVPFWTVHGTDRQLLCDIWRPADGNTSGLAFIYIHGGAWWLMDKDFATRPLFRHLVAQGHTVMDVAYRLCPEVDIYGMIGDVKRAVAWMKANAARYGVDPERIVLGGGSSGAHLAQLAAYTPGHPELTPQSLIDEDQSVCGVVSYYGQTDLLAYYDYMDLQMLEGLPPLSIGPDTPTSKMDIGRMDVLLGGYPQDVPEAYILASPTTHVHPGSPPTLLIQGEKDFLIPIEDTRAHYSKLVETGTPAINIVFPMTNHGFDLMLPQTNPAAQSALYDVDRFLALLLNID